MRNGRGALRLNCAEFWEATNQPKIQQLLKSLADRAAVSHVAARNHHVVGNLPGALLHHLEGDSLLPFYAKRVYRIRDVYGWIVAQILNQAHAIVKISVNFVHMSAVIETLGELLRGNLPAREQDGGSQSSAGSVGGKAGGSISRARAHHCLGAQNERLGDGSRHPGILEGA